MWAKRWDVDHEVEEKAEEPTTWRRDKQLRMTRQSRGKNERGIEVVGGFRMMNVRGVLSWDTWETRSGILFGGGLRSGCVLD